MRELWTATSLTSATNGRPALHDDAVSSLTQKLNEDQLVELLREIESSRL